jgi:putative phosphoribosyl transferase
VSREASHRFVGEAQLFRDRVQAARALSAELGHYAHRNDVVVLALPRGGVPVGYEIARALGAELDVILVRKLGVPGHEERAAGAIAACGVRIVQLDPDTLVDEDQLDRVTRRAQRELELREKLYRADRQRLCVENRIVILVDDGIATGATMRAAIEAVRRDHPAKLVVAVPVIPAEGLERLRAEADEVVCLASPDQLGSISSWYADFRQVDDPTVRELLDRARRPDWRNAIRAGQQSAGGHDVKIPVGDLELDAQLSIPKNASGTVLLCSAGVGCPRSPRDRQLVAALNEAGLGTLSLSLLTVQEAAIDAETQELGFDVDLLAWRLHEVVSWIATPEHGEKPGIGLFSVGTGGAAALRVASRRPDAVRALVLRSGRTDLAGSSVLAHVLAPTLMIAGSRDAMVLALNREAVTMLRCPHRLEVVPGASQSFEEPGIADELARLTIEWFRHYL